MNLSRRAFLKAAAAGTVALMLPARVAQATGLPALLAAIPGGTLDLVALPKYATPLLVPPVMPRAGVVKMKRGKQIDYYEISMKQISQQILPAGQPATTVWAYGATRPKNSIYHAPSLTIEANAGAPIRVKWINGLVDANGAYLPHLLPVDQTLHWANPPGGAMGRDTRPTFGATPGSYTGPVPMVTHVHGQAHVGDESDGYAEAWYLPVANNIPAGYATEGTWYNFFKAKGQAAQNNIAWAPGSATFQYPNSQRASTVWYHDHALGMTRLNVYAGPAGFYLVRGGPEDRVRDSRSGKAAVLPGPAPQAGDKAGKRYYEIPIAIQDRAFNADGSLFYPDSRAFFDGIAGPFTPDSDIAPIWNPEFFGNCMMVNGATWPFLNVEQRRYRFRFLNGCDSRFLILDFNAIPGVQVTMIGNEGGFLAAPVDITATGNQHLMAPAERADVIVDFTNVPVSAPGTGYVLGNVGPDAPFGGLPIAPAELADPATTGQIMQFRVGPARSRDTTTPPQFLVLPAIAPPPAPSVTRRLALLEMMSMDFVDAPAEAMLGTVDAAGMAAHQMWMDPITENPAVGATEVWEFYNFTADAHPMHIHEVFFQVVNREGLVLDGVTGEPAQPVQLAGSPRPPEAWELGWKDTVIAYPGEVTRVVATYANPGQFVWHCHIVEHEDNEMMRPYRVGPAQAGQPGGMAAADAAAAAPLDVEEAEIVYDDEAQNIYLPFVGN